MSNVVTGGYMDETVNPPAFPSYVTLTVLPQTWRLQVSLGGHTWNTEPRAWNDVSESWNAE